MMMRIKSAWIVVLLLTLVAVRCGAGESERAIGVWKSAERKSGRYMFAEITRDTANLNGKESDVVLEERDGRVSVRVAGRDDIIAVITVVNDDTIEIALSNRNGKLKMVRSSKDEWDAETNPSVDRITGLWRSEKNDPAQGGVTVLEITPDGFVVNNRKASAVIGSKNGVYTFVVGSDNKGTVKLNDEGAITVSFDMTSVLFSKRNDEDNYFYTRMRGKFVRTTEEEVAAFAAAAQQAMPRYFGFWRSRETNFSGVFEFTEIGDGYITLDGQRIKADMGMSEKGFDADMGGKGRLIVELTGDDTATFRINSSEVEMVRSSPEEKEKIVNPNLTDFEGFWILDGDAATYKTICIDGTTLERDGLRHSFVVDNLRVRNNCLRLKRHSGFIFCELSHVGNGGMGVTVNGTRHVYRRATQQEFNKAAAGLPEPLGGIPGYWRSAAPVAEGGVHATLFIEHDAQGSSTLSRGSLCDRIVHHFLDRRNHEPRNRLTLFSAEGVLGHNAADTSTPVLLFALESNERMTSWYMAFRIIDANTIEVSSGNDSRRVEMIRSTKEEVDAIREAILQQK